jgi:hypothetical protein
VRRPPQLLRSRDWQRRGAAVTESVWAPHPSLPPSLRCRCAGAVFFVFEQMHYAAWRGTDSALFGEMPKLRGDLRPFMWSVVLCWCVCTSSEYHLQNISMATEIYLTWLRFTYVSESW